MDRAQFMKQLEKLLSDISEAERQEALAYYNSYFDEAGPENEASVIRELGSPGKVAAIIKADLEEHEEEYEQYDESEYEDFKENKDGYHPKEKGSNSRLILVLIALVFLSPVLVGASGGLLGVLVVLLLLPFLAVFVAGLIACVLVVLAIAFAGAGIGLFATSGAAALLVLGIGCLFMAAGILGWMFVVWMASRILPWILRKVTDFFQRILYRSKKEGQA